MTAEEKQEFLDSLASGRDAVSQAIAGVDAQAAVRTPGDGRWSVLEIVEHLFLVEQEMLARIQGSAVSDEPVVNAEREARIKSRGTDRRKPLQAPASVQPSGRFNTLQQALDAFSAERARTIAYVQACDFDLRCRVTTHPLLGNMNAHETLLIMAVHPHRHVAQIREALSA